MVPALMVDCWFENLGLNGTEDACCISADCLFVTDHGGVLSNVNMRQTVLG